MAQVERVRDDTTVEPSDDAAIYAAHARRLVGLAAVLAGLSQAEDVVSSAVLRAMSSPSWPDVRDHGAYLTRSVVNEVHRTHRTTLRREARERRAAEPEGGRVEPDPLPEILTALSALPLRQRAAVFLTYWADLAPSEVADQLGIGEGSVRKHLARARATLRKELQ